MQLMNYANPAAAQFGSSYTPPYLRQTAGAAQSYASSPTLSNLSSLLGNLTGGNATEAAPKKKGGLFGFFKKVALVLGGIFVLKKIIGMVQAKKAASEAASGGLDALA